MLVVVALLCVLAATGSAQTFTSSPKKLLRNAPFQLQLAANSGGVMAFVSGQADCGGTQLASAVFTRLARTHVFTITAAMSTASQLYVCTAASNTPLLTLQFATMGFSPSFMRVGVEQEFTLTNVPVGSRIVVASSEDCTGPVVQGAVGLLNTARATAEDAAVRHMCIEVASPLTPTAPVNALLGTLLVVHNAGFSPVSVTSVPNAQFRVTGSAPSETTVKLSNDKFCVSTVGQAQAAAGPFGKTVTLNLQSVARGSYFFCVELLDIYYPARSSAGFLQLRVQDVNIEPNTMFVGIDVTLSLTADIQLPATVAFGSSAGCEASTLQTPLTITALTHVTRFATAAVLFSCVRNPTTGVYEMAGRHNVVAPYTVTIGTVVAGITVSGTTNPAEVIVALVPAATCAATSDVSQRSTVSGTFLFLVPVSARIGDSTLCVTTLDGSATYPVTGAAVPVRRFQVNTGPLITGQNSQLTVDSAIPAVGSYKIVPSTSSCADVGVLEVQTPFAARTLNFATSGVRLFCVKSGPTFPYVSITSLNVFDPPAFTPALAITGHPSTITVTPIAPSIRVAVGTTCAAPVAAATSTASGSVAISHQFTTTGQMVVCAFLPVAFDVTEPFTVGTLTVTSLQHSPGSVYPGQDVRVVFVIADSVLTARATAILGTGNCATPVGIAVAVQQPDNMLPFANLRVPFSTAADLTVCIGNLDVVAAGDLVSSGPLVVVSQPTVAYAPSRPILNVPFNAMIGGLLLPTVYRISPVDQGCRSVAHSGTLVSRVTPMTTIPTAGDYALCVANTNNGPFVIADTFNLDTFRASPATYIQDRSRELQSLPPLTNLFLSATAACGSPRYATTNNAVLTAPAGSYSMCGVLPAQTLVATNQVTVTSSVLFSILTTTPLRSFLGFNIRLSGGDLRPSDAANVFVLVSTDPATNAATSCDRTLTLDGNPLVVGSYSDPNPANMIVSINDVPLREYRLCYLSRDGTFAAQLTTVTPLEYFSPSRVTKGTPTTITTFGPRAALVSIRQNADCSGALYLPPQAYTGGTLVVTVSMEVGPATGYYCEALAAGGTFTTRGPVALATPDGLGGLGATAPFEESTAGFPLELLVAVLVTICILCIALLLLFLYLLRTGMPFLSGELYADGDDAATKRAGSDGRTVTLSYLSSGGHMHHIPGMEYDVDMAVPAEDISLAYWRSDGDSDDNRLFYFNENQCCGD